MGKRAKNNRRIGEWHILRGRKANRVSAYARGVPRAPVRRRERQLEPRVAENEGAQLTSGVTTRPENADR
ncbi:MAG: hypothetical protein NVS4B3_08940 [Gemmatimonadaceae bacterium]